MTQPSASTTSVLAEPAERNGRIVVGVDGSEASVAALRGGIRMANALGTRIEAVATWRLPTGYMSMGEYEYSPEDDAKSILTGAAKSAFGTSVPDWFSTTTVEGNADQVLIDLSVGAQLLVVGSRGHGGLAGVLLGSVSASCAERAHCPVLIVR
jgi:nucleotide-binding universal stress UspA family protein